jgi:hypothetical protein
MILSLSSVQAFAQLNPPPDIAQATKITNAELTPAQRTQVTNFVTGWTRILREGDDQQITQARDKLRGELAGGGSGFFRVFYSATLAGNLGAGLDPQRNSLLVRLNTILVARSLISEGVVDLIVDAADDPAPAVRYWAAAIVCPIVNQAALANKNQQQGKILDALKQALEGESELYVMRSQLEGLACLTHPDAAKDLMLVLQTRLKSHVQKPGQPLGGEHEALHRIFRQMVFRRQQDRAAVRDQDVRLLAALGFQYLTLAVRTGPNAIQQNPDLVSEVRNIIDVSDKILMWAVGELAPQVALPNPAGGIADLLRANDNIPWPIVRLRHSDWQKILMGPPMLFKKEELALPGAPADEAQGENQQVDGVPPGQ